MLLHQRADDKQLERILGSVTLSSAFFRTGLAPGRNGINNINAITIAKTSAVNGLFAWRVARRAHGSLHRVTR